MGRPSSWERLSSWGPPSFWGRLSWERLSSWGPPSSWGRLLPGAAFFLAMRLLLAMREEGKGIITSKIARYSGVSQAKLQFQLRGAREKKSASFPHLGPSRSWKVPASLMTPTRSWSDCRNFVNAMGGSWGEIHFHLGGPEISVCIRYEAVSPRENALVPTSRESLTPENKYPILRVLTAKFYHRILQGQRPFPPL